MAVAPLTYQELRQAVLRLPQRQRLQLIKEAILTLSDEPLLAPRVDFDETLQELHHAFTKVGPLSDQERDDVRYAYLLEKHGP
jgi:hypothetical protein